MKILITNYFLKNFTGSEINALQLCEGLRDLGISADVATFFYDDPIKRLFEESGIKVLNLFDQEISYNEYDVFWTHHIHTINHLVLNSDRKDTKIIYSCLSPLSSLAAPPVFHKAVNCILSNSRGNTEVLLSEGVQDEKIFYFPNFVPESFFKSQRVNHSEFPSRIAIISNHPPDELYEFAHIASFAGFAVNVIGFSGSAIYVDPALLIQYDLVISIGKTAQYCFATKVPFYCYDHFGGPGFITPDNLDISETYNFSGRAINRRLTGQELFQDISQNYSQALNNLDILYNYCYENFHLEKNLSKLIDFLNSSNEVSIEEIRKRHPLLVRHHNEFLRLINIQHSYEQQLEDENRHGIPVSNNSMGRIELLEKEIVTYATSFSWRVTRPLRKFGKIIRKFINVKNDL